MHKWGIGIIGCGGIARIHAEAIQEIDNATLVGVSSRSESNVRRFSEEFGCSGYTNYDELLEREDVQIICLTTSSGSHASIGMDVIRKGKHLIVEKPIAMTEEEAELLIAAAAENQVQISVISQRRFESAIQRIKQVVDEGQLGKLLMIEVKTPFHRSQEYYDSAEWRGTIAEDGGVLMNQAIHQLDLLLWFGGRMVSVYGQIATQTHRMEAEDLGLAIIEFENGVWGTIMATTSAKPGFPHSMALYGEQGVIKLQGKQIVHWSVPGIDIPIQEPYEAEKSGANNPLQLSSREHRRQMVDFMKALEENNQPIVSGSDGLQSVRLVHAIYKSSTHGNKVHLKQT